MPATPSWPPASTPRLFVETPLAEGLRLELSGTQANYLGAVMRVRLGDPVRLFDDVSGEWLSETTSVDRRAVALRIIRQLRPREEVPDLWLMFAPIKKGRIDWLVEKATELGVARLCPVLTRRTIVDRLNLDRLRAHMIEAAEQCDRTALPRLDPPITLSARLADWPAERTLLFADESGGAPLIATACAGPAAILIGPEGGFDPGERAAIRATPGGCAITLGPRILRADTAAAAAVAAWMSAVGDWR